MKTGMIAAAGLTIGLALRGAANARTTAKPLKSPANRSNATQLRRQ